MADLEEQEEKSGGDFKKIWTSMQAGFGLFNDNYLSRKGSGSRGPLPAPSPLGTRRTNFPVPGSSLSKICPFPANPAASPRATSTQESMAFGV